jgi:3-hydroxymyristoyl/3-hydroxydecanoyl-(acyl carrier protein) dehydratase
MTQSLIIIAADHPCVPGHFPGNPIVPGALLLDAAVAAIAGAAPGVVFKAVKFQHVVRPGEAVALSWDAQASGLVRFEGRLQDGAVAFSGSLTL